MKALRAWRILCRLVAPASRRARLALLVILFSVHWSWAQHPASQENMQSTWGKTSFTSSVFLNRDFIIEAQILAPKAAHTKLSLIKNMHFHLFIGYMATIIFQFKMLPLLKNALPTDDSDFQLLCSQNVCHMCLTLGRLCPKLLHDLCSQSQFTMVIYSGCCFLYDKFNNMINKWFSKTNVIIFENLVIILYTCKYIYTLNCRHKTT